MKARELVWYAWAWIVIILLFPLLYREERRLEKEEENNPECSWPLAYKEN